MLSKLSQIEQKLFDIKYGRIKEGLKLDIPEIDEFFRYKQGEFNVLIGHANVGKTTTIIYLFVLWAIKHKLRFLIWSSENTSDSIVRKIIEFKIGKPITTAHDDEIKSSLDWCDKYFKIIDYQELITYKDLLKQAYEIKEVWDYDCLLVDPYNSLSKNMDLIKHIGGHEFDYIASSEFRLFCKSKNVTMFLNAHGVTEALRRVHPKGEEFEGLPQPLQMASVEGGGKWANRSDSVISCHRYTAHGAKWMYTYISILKVKNQETGGRPTPSNSPLVLKMKPNNVGYTFLGKDLINYKKEKKIEF